MTRAQQLMVDAAMKDMRVMGLQLRKEGWPTELEVNYLAERDTYAVSLTIALPSLPEPIEARAHNTGEKRDA